LAFGAQLASGFGLQVDAQPVGFGQLGLDLLKRDITDGAVALAALSVFVVTRLGAAAGRGGFVPLRPCLGQPHR
jgi:hypothetical protein